MLWLVVGGLEDRPARRVAGPVLGLGGDGPGEQVVAVVLTDLWVGVEAQIGVEAFSAVGVLVVAGPLDPVVAAQLVVAEARVVAGGALGAGLPGPERSLGLLPADQRLAVAVAEVHPGGVVQEDVEVAAGLAGRVDRPLGQVDGAVGVGEGAGPLAPDRGGPDHGGRAGRAV